MQTQGPDQTRESPQVTGTAATIFALLAGRWRIDRRITPKGRFEGLAHFAPGDEPGLLAYREEGETAIEGRRVSGHREYLYRLCGNRIEIRFAEAWRRDQLYVSLDFMPSGDGALARDVHPCAADRYDHTLHWLGDDLFETTIIASGPTKDYTLHSIYQRIG